MQHALPATRRDYAPPSGYRQNLLYRSFYLFAGRRDLLAPLLGLMMYVVLVLMMSAEVSAGIESTQPPATGYGHAGTTLSLSSAQLPGGS